MRQTLSGAGSISQTLPQLLNVASRAVFNKEEAIFYEMIMFFSEIFTFIMLADVVSFVILCVLVYISGSIAFKSFNPRAYLCSSYALCLLSHTSYFDT